MPSEKGDSLVEVVVSFFLIGLTASVILPALLSAIQLSRTGSQLTAATSLAEQQLEKARAVLIQAADGSNNYPDGQGTLLTCDAITSGTAPFLAVEKQVNGTEVKLLNADLFMTRTTDDSSASGQMTYVSELTNPRAEENQGSVRDITEDTDTAELEADLTQLCTVHSAAPEKTSASCDTNLWPATIDYTVTVYKGTSTSEKNKITSLSTAFVVCSTYTNS